MHSILSLLPALDNAFSNFSTFFHESSPKQNMVITNGSRICNNKIYLYELKKKVYSPNLQERKFFTQCIVLMCDLKRLLIYPITFYRVIHLYFFCLQLNCSKHTVTTTTERNKKSFATVKLPQKQMRLTREEVVEWIDWYHILQYYKIYKKKNCK